MTIYTLAQKVQRNFTDCGGIVTMKKFLGRLVSPLYETRVYRIYRINLDTTSQKTDPAPEGFTFKLLNQQDKSEIEQIDKMAEWIWGKLVAKIASGSLCLVILDENKVAGFNLITFGEVFIPLIKLKRVFHQHDAWSEHIAVHKNYRRRGLATQLRYRIFDELRRRGYKKLYGGTLISNKPSLKLARKLGFKEIADVRYLKVLDSKSWRFNRIRR